MACDISIIVPVRNEEENILPLAQEVADALGSTCWSYELVFVDDGSTDATWPRIQEARRRHGVVRGLRLSRSHGQSAALWTGLQATLSPMLATLDGDRQNDPADLPKLLQELGRYDFVCGIRTKRQDSFIRRLSAQVARYARKLVLRVDFADTGCGLRAFKRSILKVVLPFNGFHRFLPVLVHAGGARTLEIAVHHRPRVAGVSKYGISNRLVRGIADLLAVAWYQRRQFGRIEVEETQQLPASACASAARFDDGPDTDRTTQRSHSDLQAS